MNYRIIQKSFWKKKEFSKISDTYIKYLVYQEFSARTNTQYF